MSCWDKSREGEEFKRPGSSRVADEPEQSGRRSSGSGKNGVLQSSNYVIDEKVLIDPRLLFVGAKIGEGAHGKVYEGKYGQKIVAIKVLKSGDTSEEKATLKGRFIREVNMMCRVKHENLVKFVGACMEPFMVIATELLPGTSLKNYLTNFRPQQLDLRTAISFALDIACAMDCLHANGIIHRDLKPDNLLLTADQKNIKLIDFGLAREETVTEMMTAETGTYRWMAPELYSTVTLRRGEKKHYTNKVDVYSFGIVLWELLTNRMPFEGMSNLQAAYAAAFKQIRPPLPEDVPPELVFIVQSCWVEDPTSRPCFNQIIRMLNSVLFTLPAPPSPPEPEPAPPAAAVSPVCSDGKLSPSSRAPAAASPMRNEGKDSPSSQAPVAASPVHNEGKVSPSSSWASSTTSPVRNNEGKVSPSSSRKGNKLSFLKQIFTSKKAVNNKS